MMRRTFALALLVLVLGCSSQSEQIKMEAAKKMPATQDWVAWRGADQNGFSNSGNLIDNWSKEGENLIWRVDFVGRSTPIVMNGRVYVMGRVGAEKTQQEQVACFDADTGEKLWEHLEVVRNTYAPFSRVGWASPVGDPETGNVFTVGAGAIVNCFSKDGKILWTRSLIPEFGTRTGYGGRITNPVVFENMLIVSFVSAGWGDQKAMKGRHFAFDKRTGETIWTSTPSGIFKLPNLYSNPVLAVIDGQQLFIAGNSDGSVYAIQPRTGKKVWGFKLSQRGLNSSVVVDGYRVYAAHSEENIDTPTMGRIVAIDGRGTGDITKTHELWRYDAEIGYTSPLLHNNRLYYIDISANMYALNAETGELHWEHSLGTVGKSNAVWADGKIYVTETNGRFHILTPGDTSAVGLDEEQMFMPNGRTAEVYSSPAIAYNRIYFSTEEGLYCLGDPSKPLEVSAPTPVNTGDEAPMPAEGSVPAWLQIVPAEKEVQAGETVTFTAKAYDEMGRYLTDVKPEWSIDANVGTINKDGTLTVKASKSGTAGIITAKMAELSGTSRIRVFPNAPWTEDFEQYEDDTNPPHWIGTGSKRSPGGKYLVRTVDGGNKVLAKPLAQRGIQRHFTFFGPSKMANYVMQVDVMDHKVKRRRGDAGLISHGYTMDLQGKKQRLEIRSWASESRISVQVPYSWEPETWYTIKMDVDVMADKTVIRGKVWPKGEEEPEEWTITAEDPLNIKYGAPGIAGVSYTEVFFDNLKVWQK